MSSDRTPVADTLGTVELFRGLSATALEEVAELARFRRLPKDIRIFEQGQTAERAHALIEGSVRIFQSGSDGAQVVIRFIGPGETFGTVALFTDHQYPAEARTLTAVLEVSWTEGQLLQLMGHHPSIGMNVIRIIGKRLQEVQERFRELSTQRAEQRVAHALLRLARQAGNRSVDGTAIEFPLRRKDLAQIAGTTLYTASRILTSWEKVGLLVSDHQRLTLRNPTELLRIAQDLPD